MTDDELSALARELDEALAEGPMGVTPDLLERAKAVVAEVASLRAELEQAQKALEKSHRIGADWMDRAMAAEPRVEQAERALEQARQEIDAAWFGIQHGYDIEPREYFEKEAPTNGFKFALAQAIYHIWKRDPRREKGSTP